MKLKAQPIEIPADAPFRNDVLDRKPSVEFLTNLLVQVDPPFVVCVDSPWGTGKTTFLRLWQGHLAGKGIETLYFDAWATDFAEDPLLAFVSEICRFVEKRSGEGVASTARRLDHAKKVASVIARRALPVAGKLATAGILDLDKFSEGALAGLVEQSIKDSADAYLAEKGLIDRFHVALESLINTLPEQDGAAPTLFVLVDELDRCRPSYAVDLLERIKHLFNVPNVIFVLALDKSQMQVCLEAVYGVDINSTEYLRRFIDLEFLLPEPSAENFTKHLFTEFGFDEFFAQRTHSELRYDRQNLENTFNDHCRLFKLSLRAREQCFTRIRIAMLTIQENHYLFPMLLVTLVVLRTVAPEVYRKFMQLGGRPNDVINFLRSQLGGEEFLDSHTGRVTEAFLISAKSNYRESTPELTHYQKIVEDEGASESQRERAEFILRVLNDLSFGNKAPNLELLASKLELSAHVQP